MEIRLKRWWLGTLAKKFNITGICIPEKHYMVNINQKLTRILKQIDEGDYFAINKPRRYGKTTTLYLIEKDLQKKDDYECISISFEGTGDLMFEKEQYFTKGCLSIVERSLYIHNEELATYIKDLNNRVETLNDLSFVKSIVLELID